MATNYKCASIGCYSYQSPETNALFQRLQATTNQFAKALAFEPLKVDGIIGKGTTEIVLLVLGYLGESDAGPVGASAKALEAGLNTPEQLAVNAQAVTDTLTLATKQSAIASQTTVAVALPAPSPGPTAVQKATTSANAPASSTNPAVQQRINTIKISRPALSTSLVDRVPPWAAYASGAALALGALAAVGISIYKRRRSSAPATAAPVGWFRY
jgi:hypothetical protein